MKPYSITKTATTILIATCAASAKAAQEANELNLTGAGYDINKQLLKMMVAIAIVIAMGAAAVYFSKKILPKLNKKSGKKIKIIETVALGQKHTLHLIEVGEYEMLIGCSNENITKITDIVRPVTEIDMTEENAESK